MNKRITDRIISNIQDEKCPIHDKQASFNANRGVIIVSDYCCPEFYEHLGNRIKQELDRMTTF